MYIGFCIAAATRPVELANREKIMAESSDLKLEFSGPEEIRTDILETFPYHGRPQCIVYESREFSAVCPFSGLPDIATVRILYAPADKCIELKSLKLYLISYRRVGIFQEHATDRLFKDIWNLLSPVWLRLETIYATRGGIDAACAMEDGVRPAISPASFRNNIPD
jgi:7-cyano-7-deazaguanine reductase